MQLGSNLDKAALSVRLVAGAKAVQANVTELNALDAKFGDGDHGITMNKVAIAIQDAVGVWKDESIKDFFDDLDTKVMGLSGGSASSLWGILLGGMGLPLHEETSIISPAMLKSMLQSSLSELQDLSTAKLGSKTMLDAFIPAVEAAQAAPENIEAIFKAAALASCQGAKATEQMVAKLGRAKNAGEKSLGTPDPGAVSLSLFFTGMAEAE